MNEGLLQSLRELRNEIAHGQERPDVEFLANRLGELEITVPPADLQWFVADLLRSLSGHGENFVPPVLLDVVRILLEGRSANVACDPWAGLGVLAASVHEVTHARTTIACAQFPTSDALARVLTPQLDWRLCRLANPLAFLDALTEPIDVIASVLPFGVRAPETLEICDSSGERVRSRELAPILLAATSMRLSPEGVGLFVVSPRFFFDQRSILTDLPRLGLGVEAALALPAGSFAPYTGISTYFVVVRKRVSSQMFVAQLSRDLHTNRQIVANLREANADGALELGRFVATGSFRGFESLRLADQLQQAARGFQGSETRLGDLAEAIHLGRAGAEFEFPGAENALYVPLIGISDVVDSTSAMTIKRRNYAQVIVDKTRSDARFVARFLNSELGRSIREAYKVGAYILKLNTAGVKELRVVVPNLKTQREILEMEARVEAEQNALLGLQTDLAALRRELWTSPGQLRVLDSRLSAVSRQLVIGATSHTLEQWFETLPFPLASILRAWQATPSDDYKTKYEHLLHFFEAVAEFLSVIYLSAYSSQPELFIHHRSKLSEVWKRQNLSLERATFGTWKVVVEYFAKQTRDLLSASADSNKRLLCAEMFADPTMALPEMMARKEPADVLSRGNKLRNDWTGHGGVVSLQDARRRNEQLLSEVQRLRDAMAEGWSHIQLIRCLQCKPRRGMFDNEVAILTGSNSEFLKEPRSMSVWLDVDRLYLGSRNSGRALLLLPLMQVGASPASAKNACYFFNRIDRDGARFISYHFIDQPEVRDQSDETFAAIRFLTEVGS